LNKITDTYFSSVIGLAFRKLDVFGYYKFVTAVKNINLLPNRDEIISEKKTKFLSNFAFKGVIGLVSLVYVILFSISFWQIMDLNKKTVNYENIVQEHSNFQVQQEKYSKDLRKMTTSLELSKSISSNKVINFRVLAQIASSVPRGVKFKSLDYDGNNQLIIEGSSSNDQNILQLIKNLNEKKLVNQATLATMNSVSMGQASNAKDLKGFKIICKLEV